MAHSPPTSSESRERAIAWRQGADEGIRLAMEASPEAIVVVDREGRIVLVNSETERLFGYRREELLGQPVEMLVPERFRAEHPRQREAYLARPEKRAMGQQRNVFGRRKDGTEVPLEIGLNPLETDDGWFVLSTIVDITERIRAQRERERYAVELQRSNQELRQFAYVASHDLKEPLRMVTSYTELLAQEYGGRLDGEAGAYLRHITDGAARMRTLIDELLDYSRVGHGDDHVGPVDLRDVLRAVLVDLDVAIRESSAVIQCQDLPVVQGNAARLAQLFQNLLSNALKFHGDRPPCIRVTAVRDGEQWVFAVADNGIGISPEHRDRVFQLFQRLHTREEYPGTGIGLAVCQKVVQAHGGRIWLESSPGQGATFRFTLPADGVRPTDGQAGQEGPALVASRSPAQPPA